MRWYAIFLFRHSRFFLAWIGPIRPQQDYFVPFLRISGQKIVFCHSVRVNSWRTIFNTNKLPLKLFSAAFLSNFNIVPATCKYLLYKVFCCFENHTRLIFIIVFWYSACNIILHYMCISQILISLTASITSCKVYFKYLSYWWFRKYFCKTFLKNGQNPGFLLIN